MSKDEKREEFKAGVKAIFEAARGVADPLGIGIAMVSLNMREPDQLAVSVDVDPILAVAMFETGANTFGEDVRSEAAGLMELHLEDPDPVAG